MKKPLEQQHLLQLLLQNNENTLKQTRNMNNVSLCQEHKNNYNVYLHICLLIGYLMSNKSIITLWAGSKVIALTE